MHHAPLPTTSLATTLTSITITTTTHTQTHTQTHTRTHHHHHSGCELAVATLTRLEALTDAISSAAPVPWVLPPPPPALAPTPHRLAATACEALAAMLDAPLYPFPPTGNRTGTSTGAGGRQGNGNDRTASAGGASPSELVLVGWMRGGVGAPVVALKACVGDPQVGP